MPKDADVRRLHTQLNRLKRTSSGKLGQLVGNKEAKIYLIEHDILGFKLTELEDDIDIDDSFLLGRGNQGAVYACAVEFPSAEKSSVERRLCVLKQLPTPKKKIGMKLSTENEPASPHVTVTAEQQTSTENNVIQAMGIIEHDGSRFLLLPFCGLFLDKLQQQLSQESSLYYAIFLHIAGDLLHGLKYLHEKRGVVHGDIKPENIAYYNGHWCFLDLDCSRPKDKPVDHTFGTPGYMHPQCFSNVDFCADPRNDIYALGVVLKLLLQNQEMMEKHADMKKLSLRDIAKKNTKEWCEVVCNEKKKIPTHAVVNLEVELKKYTSMRKKIEEFTKYMSAVWVAGQPSLDDLIASCEKLKQELLTYRKELYTLTSVEDELNQYYQSLISKPRQFGESKLTVSEFLGQLNTFDSTIESPINNISPSLSRKLSSAYSGNMHTPELLTPNTSNNNESSRLLSSSSFIQSFESSRRDSDKDHQSTEQQSEKKRIPSVSIIEPFEPSTKPGLFSNNTLSQKRRPPPEQQTGTSSNLPPLHKPSPSKPPGRK